ncbi:MAG TPA: hypothetical protein VNB67_03000 [Nitrososphaeraceae archaeon]|jgi:hypothetical protein|nr:hypothetical protein [Nitrososphaeraceae archaeon]
MYQVILENKYDYNNRSFALCESCYWTATIFTRIESYNCPVCRGENVELIPLNLDEKYEYQLEPDKGLEIKFSINEEISDLETED